MKPGHSTAPTTPELPHIIPDRGFQQSADEATSYIRQWSISFLRAMGASEDRADLRVSIDIANEDAGIRCLTAELLLTGYCSSLTDDLAIAVARNVGALGRDVRDIEKVRARMEELELLQRGMSGLVRWVVVDPNVKFSAYDFQNTYPSVVIRTDTIDAHKPPPAISGQEALARCKSEGQRRALAQLAAIARVRHEFGPEVAGIKIRPSALLIGMSGVGKTFVGEQFAAAAGWPIIYTTVAGWMPIGGKSEPFTLREIQRQLARSPIVCLIDECDKIRVGPDTHNWWRSCLTELMLLLDRDLREIQLSKTEAKNLRRSWIICAGAFQDIYKLKLGQDVLFAEQIASAHIDRADLEEHSGLPTEFLNRLGTVITVAAPSPEELCAAYGAIEEAVGYEGGEKERAKLATEACLALKGFRGLEEHVLRSARKVLAARSQQLSK